MSHHHPDQVLHLIFVGCHAPTNTHSKKVKRTEPFHWFTDVSEAAHIIGEGASKLTHALNTQTTSSMLTSTLGWLGKEATLLDPATGGRPGGGKMDTSR